MLAAKVCPVCNSHFTPKSNSQRYCSRHCAYKSKRVYLICAHCGETFDTSKSQSRRKKYCSRACQTAHKKDRITLNCRHCKKDFVVQRYYAENGRIYCTKKCADAALINRVVCICAMCGKEHDRTPSQAIHGKRNFCSRECHALSQRKAWRDKRLKTRWISQAPYGGIWRKIAARIRARDNYTCQLCGLEQHAPALHVHHIKPVSDFSAKTLHKAHDSSNLITLCMSCHVRVETNSVPLPTQQSKITHQLSLL